MKERKRIIALVVVMMMVLGVMAACSGSNTGGGSTGTQQTPPAQTPSGGGDAPDNTVYNLVFTSHDNPLTAQSSTIQEWVEIINAEADGRLVIEAHFGGTLAAPGDAIDFVVQGGADICWNTVSLNPNMFKYIDILAAFGERLTSAELATYVLMGLVRECEPIANEYTSPGLKVLGVHSLGPTTLSGIGERITSLSQLKGMSVQSIGKNAIAILNNVEAAAIGVTPADLYENYSKNVCTAAMLESSLNDSQKLYEMINYLCSFNYNTSTAFILMNQQKFDSLPPDLQDLLDSKFEYLSTEIGKNVNNVVRTFVQTRIPEYNIDLYDAPQAMVDESNEQFRIVVEEPFRANCAAGGVDADEIIALIDRLIDEGRQIHGEDKDWFKQ